MSILTLFCKIDDFFLLYTQWKPATHCLRETTTPETRGRPRQLHPSEGMFTHPESKNLLDNSVGMCYNILLYIYKVPRYIGLKRNLHHLFPHLWRN